VDVEVIDAKGQRNPIALNVIDFSVSGEASWRGGIAQCVDNCILSTSLPVENGVNRVMLRSTTKSGKVTLTATSDGLKPATITLKTKPFANKGGLSTVIPSADLPLVLSRGPTPSGESYTISRKAVVVQNVTAGCVTENMTDSYDDDEETEWSCDSDRNSTWIKYTWDNAVNVSQVVMKLHSFRTTKYPVQISVDDKVVFEGSTPTSLGYVTLDLNATVGQSVTVASEDGDLGIIEAEIYTPA
jgi:beta-galactosidase